MEETFDEFKRSVLRSVDSYGEWLFGVLSRQEWSTPPGSLMSALLGAQGGPVGSLLLDIDEVVAELRSSESTVRRLIADGRLRAVRLERGVRVRRADLEAYVESLAPARGEVA